MNVLTIIGVLFFYYYVIKFIYRFVTIGVSFLSDKNINTFDDYLTVLIGNLYFIVSSFLFFVKLLEYVK